MRLTTENADKFMGCVLWQRTIGRHVRRIKVTKFPDGTPCYCTLDGTYMNVPDENEKYNIVEIIKVETHPKLLEDFKYVT
jgi:hypothetical protein